MPTGRSETCPETAVVAVVGDAWNRDLARSYTDLVTEQAHLQCQLVFRDEQGPASLPPRQGRCFGPLPRTTPAVVLASSGDTVGVAALSGGAPVLTARDWTAVQVMARLLRALAISRSPAARSRVLITGHDTNQLVPALVLAAGVRNITLWCRRDAPTHPLGDLGGSADIVLDLIDAWPERSNPHVERPMGPAPQVISGHDAATPAVALPGLLHLLVRQPAAAQNVTAYLACARVLAAVRDDPRSSVGSAGPELARSLVERMTRAGLLALAPDSRL
jgi:hypothetical protein